MGWGEYARSKVPLKLVLILAVAIVVNLGIVYAFELLTLYRFPGPVDSETLGKMNRIYENCTILDWEKDNSNLVTLFEQENYACLLKTEDGGLHLAVVKKDLFFDRYRYMKKFSLEVPEGEGLQFLSLGNALQQGNCHVIDRSSINAFSIYRSSGPRFPLVLIPMIIAEYVAYCLLFKRHELL